MHQGGRNSGSLAFPFPSGILLRNSSETVQNNDIPMNQIVTGVGKANCTIEDMKKKEVYSKLSI